MDYKKNILEYSLMILFVLAIALMLAGMVLGPFGFNSSSLFFSGAACVLCVVGMGVLFFVWKRR